MKEEEKSKIGTFIPDNDDIFYDRTTQGKNEIPRTFIAKRTIRYAFKYLGYYLMPKKATKKEKEERKKRQHHTQDVYVDKEIAKIYEFLEKGIGEKRRETLNIIANMELRNGQGNIFEMAKEEDRLFEEWLKNNGHRINKEVEKKSKEII